MGSIVEHLKVWGGDFLKILFDTNKSPIDPDNEIKYPVKKITDPTGSLFLSTKVAQ